MNPDELRSWLDLVAGNLDLVALGLIALRLIHRWHRELVSQLGRIEHAVNNLASQAGLGRWDNPQGPGSPPRADRRS